MLIENYLTWRNYIGQSSNQAILFEILINEKFYLKA